MSALQNIKRRIKGITQTAQITRTMQNISISQLHPARQRLRENQFYASGINKLFQDLYQSCNSPTLYDHATSQAHLVVLMTTDRGLCGALNQNIFRVIETLELDYINFVTLGSKGEQYLSRKNITPTASFGYEQKPTYAECARLSRYCLRFIQKHHGRRLSILSSRYVDTLNINTELLQILPLSEASTNIRQEAKENSSRLHEPSSSDIINKLIPAYVHSQCYEALLSARLAEISSRMVAMKQATDNAEDLVSDLTRQYNKIRQHNITNSIIEITTAKHNQ